MKLFTLRKPQRKTNNIIFNSPHSGEEFPADFFKIASVGREAMLYSGDSFVDQLFIEANNNGSSLISNNYARSFIDTNREAYELDPAMFSGEITEPLNDKSPKVKMGFGSIAKYAFPRKLIYRNKIPFPQAQSRLKDYYFPIHKKIDALLNEKIDEFGYSLLIDCHSMPSYEFLGQPSHQPIQPDIILGDLHGKSCHPAITEYIGQHFQKYDLSVIRNKPFAGGYNTSHYGTPDQNRHAIQIEIKKSLYMDEKSRTLNQYFEPLKIIMSSLCYQLDKNIDKLLATNSPIK